MTRRRSGLRKCLEKTAAGFTVDALERRVLLSSGTLYPLTAIPALNSDPGAPCTLYLDFHGEQAESWGYQTVPATPAYDIDGDPTTFSAQELANIQEIWARVSEAYSPFNVNVTTVDPGNWDLNGSGSQNHQFRLVIGGDGSWTGVTEGGVAYVGSYYEPGLPNTAYVFPDNLADGDPQYTADDAAHEAGHGFGLVHQSVYNGTTLVAEYNTGNGSTAPFMGDPLAPGIRATWWYGPSSNGWDILQDDLAVLSGSADGFGYRTLTVGQTEATANPLTISDNTISGSGIIESTSQTDCWSFTTTVTATDTFTVNVAPYGAMLHARLELLGSAGNVIATADSASTLSQTVTMTLAAGSYCLVVGSFGQYGDIGQYSLTGTVAGSVSVSNPPVTNPPGTTTPSAPVVQISGAASATDGSIYSLDLSAQDSGGTISGWTINWGDGSATQDVSGDPTDVTHVYDTAGQYAIQATLTDNTGSYDSNSLTVSAVAADDSSTEQALQFTPLPTRGATVSTGVLSTAQAPSPRSFAISAAEVLTVNLTAARPGLTVEILDSSGDILMTRTGRRSVALTAAVNAGDYSVQVLSTNSRAGAYHLKLAARPMPKHPTRKQIARDADRLG